ncbi:MAG: hypothetical protein HXS44_07465 [Theionarchaea archaeon]|nr:hypothetical protein [Theionarchaea archaeon]
MLKLRNSIKERVFEVREEKENLIFELVDVAQEERGMIEKIGYITRGDSLTAVRGKG